MALDLDEVRRIAALARLELKPAEEELFVEQLSEIVDYVDQLREFETAPGSCEDSLAEPMACGAKAAPEADDVAADTLPRTRFLDNAPRVLDGYLVVPRVVTAEKAGEKETKRR